MAGNYRRKYAKKFRMYKATVNDKYIEPKKIRSKPSDGSKQICKQQETEVIINFQEIPGNSI